ncbi:MAG: hypothetical protein HQL23_06065 [Candidatus Omnitrophica bacterium]|nr:hypothetical protein [Candidatus Omnitrophota bacterium]
MFTTKKSKKVAILLLTGALLMPSTRSFAWERDRHEGRHFYRYHERPSFGLRFSYIPDGCFTVGVSGRRYYYYDGLYYNRLGTDYVLIVPPIGAVVTTIPPEYSPVMINGVTYYTDNGIYYVYTPQGYQVVPQPMTIVPAAPVVAAPAPQVVASQPAATAEQPPVIVPAQGTLSTSNGSADETFTVNIPNKQGGYTAVTMKKSGIGFLGPQGEFYAEFPKVSQLQVMYGK